MVRGNGLALLVYCVEITAKILAREATGVVILLSCH